MDDKAFSELSKNIIESMFGFISIDNQGKITYINKHYASSLNHTQEELIGLPVEKAIPDTRLKIVLVNQKEEKGQYMFPEGARMGSICNRMLVYQDGDRDSGEVVGAMAYGVLTSSEDVLKIQQEIIRLRKQNDCLLSQLFQLHQANNSTEELLSRSAKMQAVKDLIQRVAGSSAAICILGETGTGKELVANAIHKQSKRADKPFIKLNCATIPKELVESELFGYEPGAFTGAARRGKIGVFELANQGTLLLDEIGEFPLNLQAKLLRALQQGEIKRVGGTSTISVDVRLICSTNQNLQQMVNEGLFRADLYYRISTMEIMIPPLRERLEDIRVLVPHFIDLANKRNDVAVSGINERVYRLLDAHSWPGNVRELEHSIERACILCNFGELDVSHFNNLPVQSPAQKQAHKRTGASSLRAKGDDEERQIILDTLAACGGNRTMTAEQLNISRATLYYKLNKYGIS